MKNTRVNSPLQTWSNNPTKEAARKRIEDYLQEFWGHDLDKILLADGFESAFIGVVESFGIAPKACYDLTKCLDTLMVRDNMTYEEAVDYLNFNVTQAYVGDHTPAFINVIGSLDTHEKE